MDTSTHRPPEPSPADRYGRPPGTVLVASRELAGPAFVGRLEVRYAPANQALPFALWWRPSPDYHGRHYHDLQLSARATAAEALDLDLPWAEQELKTEEFGT